VESLDTNLTLLSQWLLRATLQGSLLVCLILAIKLALRERLPARWHYCLWLILLVRLALPWVPQSRLSVYNFVPQSLPSHRVVPVGIARSEAVGAKPGTLGQEAGRGPGLTGAQGEAPQRQQGGAAVSAPSVVVSRPSDGTAGAGRRSFAASVAGVVPWLWLCGCLVLGGYTLLRAFGVWWAVRSERPVTDQQILDLLEDCKMQMRVRTLVAVVVTDKIRSPALFGFLRPRILLPQGLIETLGLDELHYVFLHELAHLKRHDIYLAWLVCLLRVLHWFNPLIWLAFRRMRADQEMAADALALVNAGTDESRHYGQTIVNLLERFSRPQYLPSLAGILENASHIETRIHRIARFREGSIPVVASCSGSDLHRGLRLSDRCQTPEEL
jgi:bla regulator protein BlaR1